MVAEAADLTPRFYLLHLAWDHGTPKQPHALDDLAELDGILEPPGDSIDALSLWCQGDDEKGLVFVEHQLNGAERLQLIDWPTDQAAPQDCKGLKALGWQEITGPLLPRARANGVLVPTGQRVEYWVRPVIDDFMLLRAIDSPGEAISLKKLIPDDGLLVEFDGQEALEAALPPGFYCRFVSPQEVGFGRSALPAEPRSSGEKTAAPPTAKTRWPGRIWGRIWGRLWGRLCGLLFGKH